MDAARVRAEREASGADQPESSGMASAGPPSTDEQLRSFHRVFNHDHELAAEHFGARCKWCAPQSVRGGDVQDYSRNAHGNH